MGRAGLLIAAAAALAGCVSDQAKVEIGGNRIVTQELELKQDFRGRRVVQMVAIQPLPIFTEYSAEMGEMMAEAGRPRAETACGGPVELLDVTRWMFLARTAHVRFHCL